MLAHRSRLARIQTLMDTWTFRSSHADNWPVRFQEDADLLVVWYSGWYNGLAKKHLANPDRAKRLEHEIIVHCKGNPGIRVIDAIAVVFKDERMRLGIKMAE
jgi:hypothetical protein